VHILITTDTLSGVWSYTRELVTALTTHGVRVTLVSIGEIPLPQQTAWMENLRGLEYHPTAFRLEWMQDAESDLKDSSAYLCSLIHEIKPDLLHFNQVCYGSLPVAVPRVVAAHSDLLGWWQAVHGRSPEDTSWLRWYREVMTRGLAHASTVIAPSLWMLDSLHCNYSFQAPEAVIYPGRNPLYFNPYVTKEETVLAVGRLWDAGKQLSLLTQQSPPMPVTIVSDEAAASMSRNPIRADVKLAVPEASVAMKGPQNEGQMRGLYSRAAVYAATSRYEPFSLPVLEAALSRCAIVANDIPAFREVWGDAALYFQTNNAGSLSEVIRQLRHEPDLARAYGNRAYQRARQRFTAKQMLEECLQLYRSLVGSVRLAA
jgi:glycogen(starch) synthase